MKWALIIGSVLVVWLALRFFVSLLYRACPKEWRLPGDYLIILILLVGCATKSLPPVPSNQPTTRGGQAPLMSSDSARAVVVPPPKVTKIHFSWNYPTIPIDGFILCITNVVTGTGEEIFTGRSTSYTFIRTNWAEAKDRHWYAVKAVRGEQDSEPSNRIPWPLFPPDRMTITSSGPTTLQVSANLKTWSVLGPTPATVQFFPDVSLFYRGTSMVKLFATAFNPLNGEQ